MPLFEFEGKTPTVHPTAFVAPTATLVGDVTIEENASVWYGTVLRADFEKIIVRAGANIQDGSVLHADGGTPCDIGPGATVAHLCLVHGAVVGEEALIGNHSTVLDRSRIGARSMIAAGSLVTPGTEIPEEVLALGAPARVKGPIAGTNAELWVAANPEVYRDLAQRHRAGVREVPRPDAP
jgi:carbonic anhydrase/acetyltransferase-like protein (isoleucine patch superfamily)